MAQIGGQDVVAIVPRGGARDHDEHFIYTRQGYVILFNARNGHVHGTVQLPSWDEVKKAQKEEKVP